MASISGPYTNLPLHVVGFLVAAALLGIVAGRRWAWGTVPVVVLGFLAVFTAPALWGSLGLLDIVRSSLEPAPGVAERESCFVESGRSGDLAVTRWLATRIPESSRFALDTGTLDRPCVQYALLPRLIVARTDRPQFVAYVQPRDTAARARLRRQRRLPAAQRSLVFLSRNIALERLG